MHLVPKLADDLVIGILGGVSKRLEVAIRKVSFDFRMDIVHSIPAEFHYIFTLPS